MTRTITTIKITAALMCASLLIGSCNKVFDVDRAGGVVTPDKQWSSQSNIEYYINNLYSILPAWNRNEVISAECGGGTPSALKGTAQVVDDYPDFAKSAWASSYSNIRALNTFFANIDNAKSFLDAPTYNAFKGQAYFFRAYTYYQMVKVLGGVPIITTVEDPFADINTLMVPRNSSLECFNYICGQLDSAIMLLPSKWDLNNTGRVTKGAAMAVKGEVLLLKASPLFCKTKNDGYWKDAYNALTAAKQELDANGYGLYEDNTLKATENVWYNKDAAAKEMVLYMRYHYPDKTNGIQMAQRPLTQSSGDAGRGEPTWEMVKAFPMKNGKNITDPSSGYNEGQYWVNRDPRFYNAVVYNGCRYDFANVPRIQWVFQIYVDLDGYRSWNSTGFYSRKEIDTTLGSSVWNQQAFDWPIIRYAEVLLNLAEAANEVGRSPEARPLLISIRKRAKIDAGDGSYGLNAGVGTDYQATLDAILHEKQIEFYLEGKRFWDLRRRRLFSVLNNIGTIHAWGPSLNVPAAQSYGINTSVTNSEVIGQLSKIMLNPPASLDINKFLQDITIYSLAQADRTYSGTIDIKDNYYFRPMHPDWLSQNPKLKQNIGWDNGDFDPVIQ
ncbi:RagB/SusD family nutrient uptake outer membrane protein [Danxiaibacter flavus]|uniref:RagB/SusD family nutrient uptake outer membrane protein n=1 Tax=Danxiaibacter flavus TaxID=3049108 RepID=A0ABV3ZIS3_9BACT|nr:RagB/SusD family nutrient uptake outer membrane protein [Chitinophagaceae bacterium DXS]